MHLLGYMVHLVTDFFWHSIILLLSGVELLGDDSARLVLHVAARVAELPGDFDIWPAGLLVLLHDDPLGVGLLRHSACNVATVGCLLVEWLPELELDGHALEGGGRGDAPLAPAEVLHLLRRRRDRRRLLDHEAGADLVEELLPVLALGPLVRAGDINHAEGCDCWVLRS